MAWLRNGDWSVAFGVEDDKGEPMTERLKASAHDVDRMLLGHGFWELKGQDFELNAHKWGLPLERLLINPKKVVQIGPRALEEGLYHIRLPLGSVTMTATGANELMKKLEPSLI